jgi:hypothetical protein
MPAATPGTTQASFADAGAGAKATPKPSATTILMAAFFHEQIIKLLLEHLSLPVE